MHAHRWLVALLAAHTPPLRNRTRARVTRAHARTHVRTHTHARFGDSRSRAALPLLLPPQVVELLRNLSKGVSASFPHGKLAGVPDDAAPPPPALPSKADVLRWQQRTVMPKVAEALRQLPTDLDDSQAQLVQEHLVSELLCNNLPPVRLYCLRTLQVPATPGQPYKCTDPDCNRGQHCKGNRLEVLGQFYCMGQDRISLQPTPHWDALGVAAAAAAAPLPPAAGIDMEQLEAEQQDFGPPLQWVTLGEGTTCLTSPTPKGGLHMRFYESDDDAEAAREAAALEAAAAVVQEDVVMLEEQQQQPLASLVPTNLPVLKMVLPHHKTERAWGPYALEVELPFDLAVAIHLHVTHARPQLLRGAQHNLLLVRPGFGTPMALSSHLTLLWHDMQAKHEAPWSAFAPNSFRHVHVGDRVQHLSQVLALTGFEADGDAAVMTNTAGVTWERHYQKRAQYLNEMAKGAVDRITAWRIGQVLEMEQRARALAALPGPSGVGGAALAQPEPPGFEFQMRDDDWEESAMDEAAMWVIDGLDVF